MKLWRILDPYDQRYATASAVGTFDDDTEWRLKPLVIEWEPGSNLIGDFTWASGDLIVTERVGDIIQAAGIKGVELAPIKMQENSERSKRRSKAPRVQLPYKGPVLRDLYVTGRAQLDRKRSSLKVTRDSDGTEDVCPTNIEARDEIWNETTMEVRIRHRKRVPGKGMFVRTHDGIFRIPEFSNWLFCSNVVKTLIEKQGFNNVTFLEMGDLL